MQPRIITADPVADQRELTSIARLSCEPQADQAAACLRLGGVDETAPVVQCRVVVSEEDIAGRERELDEVGRVVEGTVEGIERLALTVAQRLTAAVMAQFDVQAVVADVHAV